MWSAEQEGVDVNGGQLGRALIEQNPWWASDDWARDDPDLRGLANAPFEYRPLPLAGIAPDGLYLLLGPRRVGKSVELKRAVVELIASGVEPRRIVYFSCDALRAADLPKLFRAARNLTRIPNAPRYWLLDEITSVAGWAAVTKGERDQTRLREDCVVLTGSSSRDLQDAAAELAVRHGRETADAERLLLPMPFRAFCHAIGVEGLPDTPPVRPRDVFMSRRIVEELHFARTGVANSAKCAPVTSARPLRQLNSWLLGSGLGHREKVVVLDHTVTPPNEHSTGSEIGAISASQRCSPINGLRSLVPAFDRRRGLISTCARSRRARP